MATARRATDADLDELIRLAGVMYASLPGPAGDPSWADRARALLSGQLDGHRFAAFVVDGDDGRLRASAAVSVAQRLPGPGNPTGTAAYVQWVATDPEHRGQGLARLVMQALLAWCASQGVARVELHATPAGEPLYRSLGFGDGDQPYLRTA